jgi:3-oxoacyl-[acyl-carrier protein] reductase
MSGLLQGKTAIVYGAGGSVGGAVARAFTREGAKVFLVGRTFDGLETVAKDITADGGSAETAQVDVLDAKAVEQHANAIAEKAGRIDISFNAVMPDGVELGKHLVDLDVEHFADPISSMMKNQLHTVKAVAKHMTANGSGVLMTVTSPHGRLPAAYFGAAGAIQGAIEGLWRQLAAELSPQGVRVICLCSAGSPDAPSMQDVGEMLAETSDQSREEMEAASQEGTLLRRYPMLAEVGNVAAIMASDYASPITGAITNVTCGAIVD